MPAGLVVGYAPGEPSQAHQGPGMNAGELVGLVCRVHVGVTPAFTIPDPGSTIRIRAEVTDDDHSMKSAVLEDGAIAICGLYCCQTDSGIEIGQELWRRN